MLNNLRHKGNQIASFILKYCERMVKVPIKSGFINDKKQKYG